MYIGTDFGVFYTGNLGVAWEMLGTGLPIVPVDDLAFHTLTRTLVAGTHGRSMYKTAIPCPDIGDTDGDGFKNACDNCASVFNPDQADSNRDGFGDACDGIVCSCPFQDDFDEDGFVTALDLGQLIDILFAGHANVQDAGCPAPRGDADCDGFTTALDLSITIDYLFAGGTAPCAPCSP